MEQNAILHNCKWGQKGLTGNQLKLIALFAMTCDHVGKELLPQVYLLQIIGRLAFPIFAYMIAEGCRYTKDRKKYLLRIAALGVACQIVYFVAQGSLYLGILVTFSLSICMIYGIERAKIAWCGEADSSVSAGGQMQKWMTAGGAVCICLIVYVISVVLPVLLDKTTDFAVDYGIWGILLPVFVYFVPKYLKVPMTGAALIPLCMEMGGYQWYCLGALLLLAFYCGRRGKKPMKNLFFIYYPAHLILIFLLGFLFNG